MNLVVDAGNSFTKVGIFDDQKLAAQYAFSSLPELKEFLQNYSADNLIVSSVTHDAFSIVSWASHSNHKLILDSSLPLPVINTYATPETLGVDRIAGVCGARQLYPASNCLVIDTGTCITYDFLNSDGTYVGGGISPGLLMRFEALNTFTKKLPLIGPADDVPLIGQTTEASIQSGVVNGVIAELNGVIALYRQRFSALRVILCGGDALFFENKLKGSIFAVPELVLSGLNSILIYNVGR
jgi:type III pantothenate kinase